MTEPVPDKRGFEHKNVFYEFVPMDDWLHRDFTLARVLTRVSASETISDYLAFAQASFAVAVWHQNPQEQMDRIAAFVGAIKPAEVKEIGFTEVEADDARPPDGQASSPTLSDSSETGESSSEST